MDNPFVKAAKSKQNNSTTPTKAGNKFTQQVNKLKGPTFNMPSKPPKKSSGRGR